ncbi:MAG: MFS transporter [Candidatus Saccharimonadales bacterium]
MREKIKKILPKRRIHESEKVYQRRWHILGVLCLSLLIVMVGNTTLNVALPRLSEDLAATNTQLQWLVDSYSLVFAGFLFLAGSVGDRFGRKGILQTGLVLFGAASAYAAFGVDTANQLIAARALMGLAGAMIMPATLSILTNVFPNEERARAISLWAGISGAGMAFGPLLTGFILEHGSWHGAFLINIPLILVALVSGALLVPRSSDPGQTKFDIFGSILSVFGLTSIVYAIIEAPNHGWLGAETLGVFGLGFIIMALFVWWELRAKHPMLDVRLFKIAAFGVSSLVLSLVFFALMGMFFNMSQLMQLVWGYQPLDSAVKMLPMSLVMVVGSILSPRLVERFGKKVVVGSGMLIMSVGVAMLATMGVSPNYIVLVTSMCIAALGMATAMSPTTDLMMSAVPRARAGMGSAMNDTTRELGGSLGVAVLGSLLASQYGSKIAPAIANLPDQAKEIAASSLAGALKISEMLPEPIRVSVLSVAKEAWISGFRRALVVGAIIIAISSLVAFIWLPNKSEESLDEVVHG